MTVAGEVYHEQLSSGRTQALFWALALTGLGVFGARWALARVDGLALIGLAAFGVFLFYALNYRTLVIRLTAAELRLTFGVFTWRVPLENVADCQVDVLPALLRYGGAGIHFMFVRGRYRASFNFLEYPRVVVALRRPAGPVRDISFSTRRPAALCARLSTASAGAGV